MVSPNYLLSENDRRNGFHKVSRRISSILAPKERLNVVQWADKYRYLGKGVSFKSLKGDVRYQSATAPHQVAPQLAFTDPDVQATVLVMASQIGGKTEMVNNGILYHVAHKPTGIVVMYPTLDSAEKYSKKKFTPSAEATPAVRSLLKSPRIRDSGNTILTKEFLGGAIYFVGANSPPSLRGASGQVLIGDEIDAYVETDEGDPLELLWKRGESFPNCVKILASTPTIKNASAIWDWFEDSDQQYWFVPCPKCGAFQILEWKNVTWPAGNPEAAYYLCAKCAAALDDKQRLAMYFAGEWRATAPFKGIRGFHLNGIYCPWPKLKGYRNRLHQMAAEHLRAKRKGSAALRVWVNTFLCECYEDETETKPGWKTLLDRCEPYGGADPTKPILPAGVCLLIAAVDVQANRLELVVKGYGLGEEVWFTEYHQILGNPQLPDTWHPLDDYLDKSYEHASGAFLKIAIMVVDIGDGATNVAAKEFVRPRQPRVQAVKGSSTPNAPVRATTKTQKKSRVQITTVGTDTCKATIYARLNITEPGPRCMHWPKGFGFDDEYFKMLTAESCRTTYKRGIPTRVWKKDRERNEALDLDVYCMAAFELLNPNLEACAKNLVKKIPESKKKDYILKTPPAPPKPGEPPAPPAAAKSESPKRRRRSMLGGGFKF